MRWLETLKDRSHVLIRPAEVADAPGRAKLDAAPPDEALSLRIIGQIPDLPRSFTSPLDATLEAAFVAITQDDVRERIVGIGEFRTYERGLRCRCDGMFDARWYKKELGTVLVRPLMELARSRGLRLMYARCGRGDHPMNDLAQQLGFRTTLDADDPAWLIHELELAGR